MSGNSRKKFSPFVKGKLLSSRVYPEFYSIDQSDTVANIGCGQGPQAVVYGDQIKKMIGVDLNHDRLLIARDNTDASEVVLFPVCSNVQKLPLKDSCLDRVIAVDIIEHVRDPEEMCREISRVLKPEGSMLITFPAMHDRYVRLFSLTARLLGLRKKKKTPAISREWNPDDHNHEMPVRHWIRLVENNGFSFVRSRASTMFPPLHLYGVPRLWFSNEIIYRIDSFFSKQKFIKSLGQSMVCIFKKR